MKRVRVIFLIAFAALFIFTSVSFAFQVLNLNINITPESSLPSGQAALITGASDNLTLQVGNSQKIQGVGLFEIELGSARISDQVKVNVMLVYPEKIRGALNNPNAFIDVAVWYEDLDGTHYYNGTTVARDPGATAQARLSEMYASAILQPTRAGKTKMYILASITVPGGAPSGAQDQLDQLEFFCDVRL
ncbi:hypothetical protein L1N85_15245 [Paenibacillus alkaliterrae]|uniref:hypothetical protein n=1 Tax=Paenibacillus alkaliterrae TaxID=320909 RepID=UPI001F17027F|nr:hypothetical protein [Paenibacillus alkaliterrae]MCF2939775.1 hypothetical protein [Paenibacillus alkaliterrae]